MNKKTYTIIGVVILLLIGLAVLVAWHPHKTTIKAASCTMHDNRKNLDLSNNDLQYIELSAIGHISNIPAGTNVDVNVKSFDGHIVTGSTMYAKSYGNYNFTLKKSTGTSGKTEWVVTSFAPCVR